MSNNLTASGSATGNPRNKTALKQGFSLVGWIRLTNSGEDLTGLKGKIIQVSSQELRLHDKPDDCWMAIRGKVYNVTRYMDFHPGGRDQLMRGAGKDATKLFDEAHSWVNIDQLLAKCFVGPLGNLVTLNLRDAASNLEIRSRLSPPSPSFLKLPSMLSASSDALNKRLLLEKAEPSPPPVEVITPRFDWIQKTHELSVYFYTKAFCNPAVFLFTNSQEDELDWDNQLEIQIIVSNMINAYKFTFLKPLRPSNLKIYQETGKIEFTFEKQKHELWNNFGIFERIRTKPEDAYSEYRIAAKNFFSKDSFEMLLRPKKRQLVIFPIGHHVSFRHQVNGQDLIRSYTPVPMKYSTQKAITTAHDLLFAIKTYELGAMTIALNKMSVNDVLRISQPRGGSLDLSRTKNHSKFSLLAAGSGVTPMMSLLDHLLERSTFKVEAVRLYFFNKTEADIWYRDTFSKLKDSDKRFDVKHILSDAGDTWTGAKGRISKALVDEIAEESTFVFVCGPLVFNDLALEYFREHGTELHCFQG